MGLNVLLLCMLRKHVVGCSGISNTLAFRKLYQKMLHVVICTCYKGDRLLVHETHTDGGPGENNDVHSVVLETSETHEEGFDG